jgi:hypothetical protein
MQLETMEAEVGEEKKERDNRSRQAGRPPTCLDHCMPNGRAG